MSRTGPKPEDALPDPSAEETPRVDETTAPPDAEATADGAAEPAAEPVAPVVFEDLLIASGRDAAGLPIHHGWSPIGGRHRWMEPFVLVLLAGGSAHGYAITGELEQMGITQGSIDVGQVYRTLRDLEEVGFVTSSWSVGPAGPQRRDYKLTAAGYAAIDEWAAVMGERGRLIAEFDARYLATVTSPRQ
jgi:PadR family transcriptional regulator, regulatory protein PadR